MADSDTNFEWELNRENIQPIRRGRHASAITSISSRPTSLSARVAMAQEKMDEVLACFDNDHGDSDCLENVISFIDWFQNNFLIGSQKMIYEFLWKCINRLTKKRVYDDDERLLKVWIKMAENSLGNECSVFDHANSIGSLSRLASFYIEWSLACESRSMWDEARHCLERGKKAGATPLTLIHHASDQLEMRILRRQRREEENDNELYGEDDNEERREAFTRLNPLDEGATPIVRIASISGSEAPSKIATSAKKLPNSKFEILTEEEGESSSWLQDVYEMKSHIQKIDLSDDNSGSTVKSALLPTVKKAAAPSFTIWEEGVEVKKKPRLMLRADLIRDMSIEEMLVEKYSVLFNKISPTQENKPKNLFLCKADIKPLSFD